MNINKRDIWYVNLNPVKGHELEKERPVIIVNTDIVNSLQNFELRIIVPLVTWKPKYDDANWFVKIKPNSINGLRNISVADPYQIRCVSEERFNTEKGRIGKISKSQMEDIENKIIAILDIDI